MTAYEHDADWPEERLAEMDRRAREALVECLAVFEKDSPVQLRVFKKVLELSRRPEFRTRPMLRALTDVLEAMVVPDEVKSDDEHEHIRRMMTSAMLGYSLMKNQEGE